MLYDNLTLSIFLHLPTGSPVQTLNLYRYLPTPFRFSNQTTLFTVDPPRTLLAASLTDESKNVELSLMDFEWCDKIWQFTFCPARPRETYNSRESCLTGLFRRTSTVVWRKCPLKPMPHQDIAVQLDENMFVLAINEQGAYRFFCKAAGFSSKLEIAGLARISIPDGCRVDGDTISMVPSPSLFFNLGLGFSKGV